MDRTDRAGWLGVCLLGPCGVAAIVGVVALVVNGTADPTVQDRPRGALCADEGVLRTDPRGLTWECEPDSPDPHAQLHWVRLP